MISATMRNPRSVTAEVYLQLPNDAIQVEYLNQEISREQLDCPHSCPHCPLLGIGCRTDRFPLNALCIYINLSPLP